jgi:hypothetical protein
MAPSFEKVTGVGVVVLETVIGLAVMEPPSSWLASQEIGFVATIPSWI